MNTKQILKDYLTFSKKDRIGIYCVITLLGLIYWLPRFFPSSPVAIQSDTALLNLLDTIQQQSKTTAQETDHDFYTLPKYENGFKKGSLFSFDPNTLSAVGWKKLGLTDRTINTILNYRKKGGKFYKPEDLQKIWGLPEGFYSYVVNHIHIPAASNLQEQKSFTYTPYERKERKITAFDINSADTSAFIALPGIGQKLATRIVNFRDKLGGFHSIEQIRETYGLPDSTFQQIRAHLLLSTSNTKKLSINSATKDELKAHPYIRWQLANAIVEYRNQHGLFKNIEEIKKILIVDESTYNKVIPYLQL